MKYRVLGKTGLKVSALCLGTMTFGKFLNIGNVNQNEANQMVANALGKGINFFDTADGYDFGKSEEMLGRAIKESGISRDKIIVATKVRGGMSEEAMMGTGDLNNVGLTRHHVMRACEASLRRLGVDYIDLYQVHGWDSITPMEETLRALDDLVRQGKVLYTGCSNWSARHLMKALCLTRSEGWSSFVSLQAYYSLVGRDLEHELRPLCQEEGIGIMPWSPLAGGFLSGKYRRDDRRPAGSRRAGFNFPPLDEEQGFKVLDVLTAIAKERHATVARIAIAWLLAQQEVSSVIIGANRMDQLEDNLGAVDVELSTEDVARLSAITKPEVQYPQWMYERQNEGRMAPAERGWLERLKEPALAGAGKGKSKAQ